MGFSMRAIFAAFASLCAGIGGQMVIPNSPVIGWLLVGLAVVFGGMALLFTRKDGLEAAERRSRADEARGLVSLKAALLYRIHREWHRDGLGDIDRLQFFADGCAEMEHLAGNGGLVIWGTKHRHSKPVHKIPAGEWESHQIDIPATFDNTTFTSSRSGTQLHKFERYYHLAVNRDDMERLFPPRRKLEKWKEQWTERLSAVSARLLGR